MSHPPEDPSLTPAPDKGPASSHTTASYRDELVKKPEDIVDHTWAGGVPAQYGVAPRVRIGSSKWFNLLWLIPIGLLMLIIGVAPAPPNYPRAPLLASPRGSRGSTSSTHSS